MAQILAIFLTSVAAGVFGAILGLGGGMLLIPVLTLYFGVDMRYAMGASIISVIATSSGAAASHLRAGLSNVRIGIFLVMATTAGAVVGARLTGALSIRWLELILALTLGYSAAALIKQLHMELPSNVPGDRLSHRLGLEGSYFDARLGRRVEYRATHVAGGVGAMFGAGMLSGLLGIGSGVFKVLVMDSFMRLPMKVSTATSNFMIGITAAASAGVYFARGDIQSVLAAPVAVGVLLGARLGARLLFRMRNVTVRRAFLPVLVYLAASMLLKSVGVRFP